MSSTLLAIFDVNLFIKGVLTVAMAFALFVGGVTVILSAILGKKLGFLVTAVSLFGWMIVLSSVWVWGFYSQGIDTVSNLGPRGTEPHWEVLDAGITTSNEEVPEAAKYPSAPWQQPDEQQLGSVDPVAVAIQQFLVDQANREAGVSPIEPVVPEAGGELEDEKHEQEQRLEEEGQPIFIPEDFVVQDVMFATASDGKTSLAAGRGYYLTGGPIYRVILAHDSGNVPVYSWIFLIGSVIGLGVSLPFLDRAEKSRKEFLTGGSAPAWRGPA